METCHEREGKVVREAIPERRWWIDVNAPRKKEENVRKLNPKRDVEVQRENGGIIEEAERKRKKGRDEVRREVKRRCTTSLKPPTSLLTLDKLKALQELEMLRRSPRVCSKSCAKEKSEEYREHGLKVSYEGGKVRKKMLRER